jgi:hypothetical protein
MRRRKIPGAGRALNRAAPGTSESTYCRTQQRKARLSPPETPVRAVKTAIETESFWSVEFTSKCKTCS